MESRVKVTASEKGLVVIVSENNPDFGYVRVIQTRMVIDEEGFLKKTVLSALIPGKVEDLRGMGWKDGQELRGKIAITEKLTPFNKKDPSRDIKVAGKSEVQCTKEGQPIYRNTCYRTDENHQDVFLQHDNKEEIKAAFDALEEEAPESSLKKSYSLD